MLFRVSHPNVRVGVNSYSEAERVYAAASLSRLPTADSEEPVFFCSEAALFASQNRQTATLRCKLTEQPCAPQWTKTPQDRQAPTQDSVACSEQLVL